MSETGDIELDLIAVGAHPDDIEIACGGTLAQLSRKGYRVGIVDLTDGEPTPLSPGPDVRMAEAQKAADVLGVAVRINLNLPNRRLFDSFEARVAPGQRSSGDSGPRSSGIRRQDGHSASPGPLPGHADHRTRPFFYKPIGRNGDEHFDGLPVHTVTNQLGFAINLHGLDLPEGSGYIVADIGPSLATKVEAIRCYSTQFPSAKAGIFGAIETMNRYHGLTAGFEAGELFMTYRTVGVDDLMRWASPAHCRPCRSIGLQRCICVVVWMLGENP